MIMDLSRADCVSGFESGGEIEEIFRTVADETRVDNLGNVIGIIRCGKAGAKKVMLDAHMDEIGLVVTEVLDGGFVRFAPVGGISPGTLPNALVTILGKERIPGVISCIPPHIQGKDDGKKIMPVSELVIDTGLSDENAKKKIKIGMPVSFDAKPRELSDGCICGKALDNRAGVASILNAASLLKEKKTDVDIIMIASAKEEVSLAGAAVAAFGESPDCAIIVDVSHAGTPDAPPRSTGELRGGVMIGVGPNMAAKMTRKMRDTAAECGIPYQTEVMEGHTGTNAWAVQTSGDGVPCSVLSIPLRYMHTASEVIYAESAEQVSRLICEFVCRIDDGFFGGDI